MTAAKATKAASAAGKPGRLWCAYQIDGSRTTPAHVTALWQELFNGAVGAGLSVLTDEDEQLVRSRGYDPRRCAWWLREGGGTLVYDRDDLPMIAALHAFFAAYGHLFTQVWVGPFPHEPGNPASGGAWLSLNGSTGLDQAAIVRGEAA